LDVNTHLRAAQRDDAEQLARVHLASWKWAYQGLLPDAYLDRLRQDELAARWWRRLAAPEMEEAIQVVDHDGSVGGFITYGSLHDDPSWLGYAGEIYMIYLAPELTGQGLGTRLMRRACEDLEGCRCHWAVVWVLARNHGARAFYEHMGWRLDGRRRWDAFEDRSVPVVRYAKALNPVYDFDSLRQRSPIG
jgi:GNAT superfamily N-acetyltransferase